MADSVIHCPACHRMLRSDRPVPVGATLRCPECRCGFSAPPPPLPEAPPPSLFGPAFAIAVAVALILGGSVITAALLLSGSRPKPEEAKSDDGGARRLADEQKKLDESRKELAEAQKRLDLGKWLVQGEAALAAGKYEDAEKAFNEGAKVIPGDPAVLKGLVSARAGIEAARKTDDDGKKRDAERDRLLAEGRKAIADKKFAEAVRALESARAAAPADAAVLAVLNEARNGLDADEAEKKKLTEYNARLAAGKTALEAARFTDAVREYAAALALMPDSPEAKAGQKQAEAKLAAHGDREKTKLAFEAAIGRARRAVADTRYNEAMTELDGALRLIGDDREGVRLLKDTKATLDKVKASNARLVAAAKVAASNGQMEEAVRLAGQAVRAWAEDESAKRTMKNAERLLDTTRTNQEAYLRFVQTGAIAMSTGQYADAVAAYTEALRLSPGNADVALALRNARLALDNYQRNRVEYERLVRIGSLALNRGAFAEALKAFAAAQKLLPDDLAAREGVNRARYGQAMLEGQAALKARKRAEAVAAFEAALAERPGDLAARRGLLLANAIK